MARKIKGYKGKALFKKIQERKENEKKQAKIRRKIELAVEERFLNKNCEILSVLPENSTYSSFYVDGIEELPSQNEVLYELFEGDDNGNVSPLYVLEPDDLIDLTLDEVQYIWENKFDFCGSIEAAAEAFAIIRVVKGIDLYYQGWQFMINEPEIQKLSKSIPSLISIEYDGLTKEKDSDKPILMKFSSSGRYGFEEVLSLDINDLVIIWE